VTSQAPIRICDWKNVLNTKQYLWLLIHCTSERQCWDPESNKINTNKPMTLSRL